jgi:hypothetical protein
MMPRAAVLAGYKAWATAVKEICKFDPIAIEDLSNEQLICLGIGHAAVFDWLMRNRDTLRYLVNDWCEVEEMKHDSEDM